MISKEQIAHDLTIVYLRNRYGIDIGGSFHVSSGDGSGDISTDHLPSTTQERYIKVKTGEKGLFGIEKKQKISDGLEIDTLFPEIVCEYKHAYNRFYELLSQSE